MLLRVVLVNPFLRCCVNRRDSNHSWSLWLILLVLLILALAIYLHSSKVAVQETPAIIPEHSSALHTETPSPRDVKTSVPVSPGTPETPSVINDTPVGLDPEAARTAVHKVENGVYERATALFEQEPVDGEWADAYEQSLREMFSQHQGLQRVSINSISCHTSMCRIEVFTPRDADADFFTAMFYDALATFRAGELKAEAAIARRMEQGMTSVYVARKDYTLGFY